MDNRIYEKIIDLVQGKVSPEEEWKLYDLMEENDQVAEAFLEIQQLYGPQYQTAWDDTSALNRWQKVANKDAPKAKVVNMRKNNVLLKVAAALIPLVIALFFLLKPNDAVDTGEIIQLATLIGESKTVELPDGSVIELNENSKLSYQSNFIPRSVSFEGEGFFDIAKDTEHPFVVNNEQAMVTVLGTQFNVNSSSEDGSIEVAVVEGKVKLAQTESPEEFVILEKNNIGKYISASKTLQKEVKEVQNEIGWKTHVFAYSEAPIHEVLTDLEKVYKLNFNYDEVIQSCSITANFDNYSLDQIIKTLEFALNGQITKNNNDWIINAEPCDY